MDVLKFSLVVFEDFRDALEQLDCHHDQIVKVKRLVFLQALLVSLVYVTDNLVKKIARLFGVLLKINQFIFRAADFP